MTARPSPQVAAPVVQTLLPQLGGAASASALCALGAESAPFVEALRDVAGCTMLLLDVACFATREVGEML